MSPNVSGTDLRGLLPVSRAPQEPIDEQTFEFSQPVTIYKPLAVSRLVYHGEFDPNDRGFKYWQ